MNNDFEKYKPLELEYNIRVAVENLKKAYWSNEPEKVAKDFTDAEDIIISAICHHGYTVSKETVEERPHGECKDCDKCEDKAKSYSMGFQDGYWLGNFQLTELRRWLISQGYSEGTVNDKINEFTGFVERIRGEEECMTNACYKKQDAKHCNTCLHYQQLTKIQELGYCETKNYHVSANSDKCISYKEKQ